MNWLDPIGAGLSLICTYYFTQAKRTAWLIGIAAIILNSILYWQKGIYGYLLLEGIYFFSMIYGWYHWSIAGPKLARPIRYLTLSQGLLFALLGMSGILIMAFLLQQFTDSNIPYWDATTTVLSLIAQWLLCLKIIHCWLLWFVVDAMVAIVQLYKGIPFHSAIHWLYLIMAVMGYWRWRQLYQKQITLPTFPQPVANS
jgi:nicotinamide mononucleotide transporter